MIKRFSIRKKLIVAFILIGVFPMLIATYIGVEIASGRLEKGLEDRINYAGKSAVYLIAKKKAELEGVARSFSGDTRLRQVLQGGVNIKFLWFDTPLQVYLFNDENAMVFSSTGETFQRPMLPEEGMILLHAETGADRWPLLVFLLPVSDQEQLIGTIMTGYPLNQEFLTDLKSVTGVESMLFEKSGSGEYLAIGREGELALDKDALERVSIQKHQVFVPESTVAQPGGDEGYYSLLTPLPDAEGEVSYILFNGIPSSETLSRKLASSRFYYVLIILGVLLSVLFGSIVATGISWPILRFSEGVRAISAGDYDHKIQLRSRDEIGELAESFSLMTDRLKETIAELVKNRNYMDNILRSLLNGVITIDSDYRITKTNKAAENILSVPADHLVGSTVSMVFDKDPEIVSLIQNCLDNCQVKEGIETTVHRKNGYSIPIELSLSILEDSSTPSASRMGLVLLIRDLTEIQALKEHIRRQDRLAALGELSAGIAHEIRNPLGIIKGAAGILKKGPIHQDAKHKELSSVILEEVDRLNSVISDFLEFARPKPPIFKAHRINELILGTLQMVSLQIGKKKVEVHKELGENLPLTMVDEHQIHQIFLNLILNALQATDEGDRLEITTRFLPNENQIEILFADTGIGISEANLKRVFNPFFTTREQGTGLGLSTVSQIIENHHGKIFLTSQVGKGTQFTIRFPVAEQFETVFPAHITRS